jgi:hypothetical protein
LICGDIHIYIDVISNALLPAIRLRAHLYRPKNPANTKTALIMLYIFHSIITHRLRRLLSRQLKNIFL